MGKCPEDGQTVLFEATEERAGAFFADLETQVWQCRLAHVCADIHAIYTPELSGDFNRISCDASLEFGESCYTLVCDEPEIVVWKNGQVWLDNLSPGCTARRNLQELEDAVFEKSGAQAGDGLWKRLTEFVWGDTMEHAFLLEK